MFEMYVKEERLNPIGIGAIKAKEGAQEKLVLTFNSDKDFKEVQEMFSGLSNTDVIKIKNERRELAYTGFTSFGDEAKVKLKDDETYDYEIYLYKPSALDVALQAQADVAFLAATQNVEL